MEKDLWEHVKSIDIVDIRKEVVEWVVDPGSTRCTWSTYDHIISTYCVMKGLMSHILMEREKNGKGHGTGCNVEGA